MTNKYYIHNINKPDVTNDTEGIKKRQQALEASSSKCTQCGDTNDLMVIFTDLKICGKCTRKNHKKAIKK